MLAWKGTSLNTRYCSLIQGVSQCTRHGYTIKLTQLMTLGRHKHMRGNRGVATADSRDEEVVRLGRISNVLGL